MLGAAPLQSAADTSASGMQAAEASCSGSAGPAESEAVIAESSTTGDGLTCAICLDSIDPANLALIPNCEHQYCATCILHWAEFKEASWCPQCRVPFSQLLTYRALDGSLRDYPATESVCLLKRTTWFQEYVKAREKGKSLAPAVGDPGIPPEVMDWHDYGRYFDEYDDDEEIETYYMSAAAGKARIVLGNRRYGASGYLSAGRMQARPVAPSPTAPKGGKASNGGSGKQPAASPSTSGAQSPATPAQPVNGANRAALASSGSAQAAGSPSTPARRRSNAASACGSDESGGGSGGRSKGGRRAQRNARRAKLDARSGGLDWD